VQWHPEDIKSIGIFISDAREHLNAGDNFLVFLQKHYGEDEIVSKHIDENHPERKKSKNKHTHHIEPIHAWSFNPPQDWIINLHKYRGVVPVFYKEFTSAPFLTPLYSPPELI
jgi:hypothetical protein